MDRDERNRELIQVMRGGDRRAAERAAAALVEENTGFVIRATENYFAPHLDKEDLIAHGIVGLLEAARLFDSTFDNTFITYAKFYIYSAITDALGIVSTITIKRVFWGIRGATARLFARGIERPTDEELAAEIGEGITPAHVATVRAQFMQVSTSNRHATSEDSREVEYGDTIADSTPSVEEVLAERSVVSERRRALLEATERFLKPRERAVVLKRFMVGMTLQEVGDSMGVSRERVRQIEERALGKLRLRAGRALEELM